MNKIIIKHFPRNLKKFCFRCDKEQEVYFSEGSFKGYCKVCGSELYNLRQNLGRRQ
jgi:ribosomal protein S27E